MKIRIFSGAGQNSAGCGLRRSARSFPRASSALRRSALASFSRDMAELICCSSSISALLVSIVCYIEAVK